MNEKEQFNNGIKSKTDADLTKWSIEKLSKEANGGNGMGQEQVIGDQEIQ